MNIFPLVKGFSLDKFSKYLKNQIFYVHATTPFLFIKLLKLF